MKQKTVFLFLLIAIALTGSQCKKQNSGPQLPPETQTGDNTLGFKIDGKVYTASGKSGLLSNEYVWGEGHIAILPSALEQKIVLKSFPLY